MSSIVLLLMKNPSPIEYPVTSVIFSIPHCLTCRRPSRRELLGVRHYTRPPPPPLHGLCLGNPRPWYDWLIKGLILVNSERKYTAVHRSTLNDNFPCCNVNSLCVYLILSCESRKRKCQNAILPPPSKGGFINLE